MRLCLRKITYDACYNDTRVRRTVRLFTELRTAQFGRKNTWNERKRLELSKWRSVIIIIIIIVY